MKRNTPNSEPSMLGQCVPPLGRACSGGREPNGDPGGNVMLHAPRPHSHAGGTDWLRDVILGGQDGLVNILGITLGVIAGGGSRTVLLAAGFGAAITEPTPMGA